MDIEKNNTEKVNENNNGKPVIKNNETGDETKVKDVKTVEIIEETDVFKYLDNLDQQAIVDAVNGVQKEASVWVYRFKDKKGNEHCELSKDGIDECIRQYSKGEKAFMRERLVKFSDDEKYYYFTVSVERYAISPDGVEHLLDSRLGFKRQAKMKRMNGRYQTDPFAFEAGGQKAIRNANKRFIPTATKLALISEAKKIGKILDLSFQYKELPTVSKTDKILNTGSQDNENKDTTGFEYKLSPKQQKMVFAICKSKELDMKRVKEFKNIVYGGDSTSTWKDRDQFQEFLDFIQKVKDQNDFDLMFETMTKGGEEKDD